MTLWKSALKKVRFGRAAREQYCLMSILAIFWNFVLFCFPIFFFRKKIKQSKHVCWRALVWHGFSFPISRKSSFYLIRAEDNIFHGRLSAPIHSKPLWSKSKRSWNLSLSNPVKTEFNKIHLRFSCFTRLWPMTFRIFFVSFHFLCISLDICLLPRLRELVRNCIQWSPSSSDLTFAQAWLFL